MPARAAALLALCLVATAGGCSTRGADEGKIVLSYTRWGDPSEMDSTREIIRQFMAENPGVVVRVDVVSWEQYWQKMATAAVTGTAQDVWLMSPAYVEQYAGAGRILDLMPFIRADKTFNLDDYFPRPFDDYCFTGKPPALQPARFGDPGARVYAFTRDYNCQLLYYNRDHFDALGLAYPNESWTWDNVVVAAKKLTIDFNGDGVIDQWGFYGLEYGAFARTNGGLRMDVMKLRSTCSDPRIVDAVRFCHDLVYKYKVAPPPDAQIEGEAFTTGKAAMTLGGTWNIRRFNASRFLWDLTSIPTDTKERKRATAGGGMGHCIYAGTAHPGEAWKLVKFLSAEASQRELARSGTSVPVLKKAAFSADFLAPFDRPPKESYPLIFKNLTGEQHHATYTRGYLEYSEFERRMFQGVWADLRTPEEACRLVDEETDRILRREYGDVVGKGRGAGE